MKLAFNPIGPPFDYVGDSGESGPDNFSHKLIPEGSTVVIPENQQMLIDGHLQVEGHLSVLGEVVDISARAKEQFFYDVINEGDVVVVEPNRLLLFKQHIQIDGHLRINGRLEQV